LRNIFRPRETRQQGSGENYIIRSFRICTVHHFFFRVIKSRGMKWVVHTGLFEGKFEVKSPLGRTRSRWDCNVKMSIPEVGWGGWTGLIWLRMGTVGRLL
jgi:hypothetical protein